MPSFGNRSLRTEPRRSAPSLIRDRSWPKLLPALVVIVPLFAAAFILAVIQSLGYFPLIGLRSFNVDAYRSLLGNGEFWQSLLLSTWIAVMAALLSTVLGIAMALGIRKIWRRSGRLAFLSQLNLPIPHVIGALAMVHLLGQSGEDLSKGERLLGGLLRVGQNDPVESDLDFDDVLDAVTRAELYLGVFDAA